MRSGNIETVFWATVFTWKMLFPVLIWFGTILQFSFGIFHIMVLVWSETLTTLISNYWSSNQTHIIKCHDWHSEYLHAILLPYSYDDKLQIVTFNPRSFCWLIMEYDYHWTTGAIWLTHLHWRILTAIIKVTPSITHMVSQAVCGSCHPS